MFTLYKKYLVRNGAAAVFLLVFALIYEYFSHGVVSGYMLGAWLIPLAGSIPYLYIERLYRQHSAACDEQRCAAVSGLWQLGIFTLSQGFVMKGIIEIYGTTNRWTAVYVGGGEEKRASRKQKSAVRRSFRIIQGKSTRKTIRCASSSKT